MRVLLITTGLGVGGAEKQLVRLLPALLASNIAITVIALRGGPVAEELRQFGIPVTVLDLRNLIDMAGALKTLLAASRAFRPDIVQGWMYHGNLAATWAWKWSAKHAKLCWGIRQTLYDIEREKLLTRQVIRLSALMSKRPQTIIYNSHTARTQHESFGFCANHGLVIDNGIDTELFQPDPGARHAVCALLNIPADVYLIGMVARYHPMKGHRIFLEAAARLAERRSDVHFLLVGRDVSPLHPDLAMTFQHPALAGRVHCLGERPDIPKLTAALDIASSSSWGEAFPNTVGEAMSCAVPVVATDVGDVRRILGDAGIVVPVGHAEALADGWLRLLKDQDRRRRMGRAGRARVLAKFSRQTMVKRYLELYGGLSDDNVE